MKKFTPKARWQGGIRREVRGAVWLLTAGDHERSAAGAGNAILLRMGPAEYYWM